MLWIPALFVALEVGCVWVVNALILKAEIRLLFDAFWGCGANRQTPGPMGLGLNEDDDAPAKVSC